MTFVVNNTAKRFVDGRLLFYSSSGIILKTWVIVYAVLFLGIG